jgi:zinc knuckle protein
MITSNLDWDEEALEDKFLEGLKPEIRKALIYYPTEPKNLELFERAQKIDRELWGQRNGSGERGNYGNPRTRLPNPATRFYEKRKTWKTDRDGDIKMKGAKVSMEKARKEGLCFECGNTGHQARNCRKRQPWNKKDKDARIRMVRSGRAEEREESATATPGEDDPTSTGEIKMFEGLTLDDLETESSTGENEHDEDEFDFEEWANHQHIHEWNEGVLRKDRMLSMH